MKKENQSIDDAPMEPCSLETMHRHFDDYFRNFDIESVPIEVRQKAMNTDSAAIYKKHQKAEQDEQKE